MLFKPSIKKRVMSVLNTRIEAEQAKHDAEIDRIASQHAEELKIIEEQHQKEIAAVTDDTVNSLIGILVK